MKTFRFFLLLALVTFIVSCDKEKTDIPPDEVKSNPYSTLEKSNLSESVTEKIKNFLSEKHPRISIIDIEITDNQIEIELSNEVEASFSLNGDFVTPKGFYSNLDDFDLGESVTEKIKNFLSENHPGIPIYEILIAGRTIEIKLNNETEISFSLDDDFLNPNDSENIQSFKDIESSSLSDSVKEKIKNYLTENHPGTPISKIKIDDNRIEIELDSEKIYFSLNGNILNPSDSKNQNNLEFAHTTIPSDINDLYEFRGDSRKDTVWVYIQGGAMVERNYDLNEKTGPQKVDKFPFFTDDFIVYPYQSQQINPSLHQNFDLTFEQAKIESSITVEIAQKVIEKYLNLDKTVYVFGTSYGAFVVNELLAISKGKMARKYISMYGRLDMNELLWKGYLMEEFYFFDSDGKTLIKSDETIPAEERRYENNMARLNAGLAFNRYTEKLANTDLSDVIFITGKNDQIVGTFLPKTIEFLTEINPSERLLVLPGTHGQIFEDDPQNFKELYDFIVMDN